MTVGRRTGVGGAMALGLAWAWTLAAAAQAPDPESASTDAAPAGAVPAEPPAPESAPAPAAKDGGLRALGVEEIVVTAQKREESINDVPIAITAFSGSDLKALGVTDTRDLNNLVPGFSYGESGYNTPVYSLRGVGFNEASQTASATVGVYVDEVNLPFAIMSKGANLDMERLEVLKGPQGTLYGRNTTGGAINYIANKPTDTFESGLDVSVGRFLATNAEGYVSGPLSDTVRGRLALRNIWSGQGWQYSHTRPGDHLGKQDKQAGRAILDWRPADPLAMSFTLSGWNDESEPQAPQAIGVRIQNAILGDFFGLTTGDRNNGLNPSVRNYPYIDPDTDSARVADWSPELDFQLHDHFWSGAVRGDWDAVESARLTLIGTYQQFRSDDSTIPQSGLGETSGERELDVKTDAYNGELRVSGTQGDAIDYVAGVFASHDRVEEIQDIHAGSISSVFPYPGEQVRDLLQTLLDDGDGNPDNDVQVPLVGALLINRGLFTGDQKATTYAAFGQVGWHFTDTWKLNVGLRYTTEKRKFTGCTKDSPDNTEGLGLATFLNPISLSQGGSGDARPGDCIPLDENRDPGTYHGTLDEDNVSGRVGLDWTPTDDLLVYGSVSRGFKSGSFPVLSASDQSQYEPVSQERLDAFEVGAKATLLDGEAQLNGATFWYDYKDKQLLGNQNDFVFGPLPVLVNAPKSRVFGVELDGRVTPVRGLLLGASVAYLDTKVVKFEGTNENAQPMDFAGNRFNFTPLWSYTLLANVVLPAAGHYDVSLGADYSYKGRTNSSLGEEDEFHHPSFFLLNARIGLAPQGGPWDVSVFGRNLTDEVATISIQKASDPFARYVEMPRTWGLSLTWRFE